MEYLSDKKRFSCSDCVKKHGMILKLAVMNGFLQHICNITLSIITYKDHKKSITNMLILETAKAHITYGLQ